MEHSRGAWAEVDLDCIVHNVKEVHALAKKDTNRNIGAIPVIKGNAYGHGIYEVAKALHENGYDWFAVAVLSEALIVRSAAPDANILILGYTPNHLFETVVKNRISQPVYTLEQAKALSEAAKKLNMTAKIHIKVDTGMHRLGFNCSEESADTVKNITELDNVAVEGIFTHFATSDMKEKSYVHYQYENFASFLQKLEEREVDIPIKHISNTGIILDNPEMHQDMIRFGSMVFGTYSSLEMQIDRVRLKDAYSLRAEISYVKDLAEGCGIGYDLTYVTKRASRIATLPIGYVDVGIRGLKNNGYVLVHGKRAPIVGGVCMDQMTVDVTDIPDVKMGDVATLIGCDGDERITLKDVADRLNTDAYEVVISTNYRLPIYYFKGGRQCAIMDINKLLYDSYALHE